jgi:uncharacterized protein (TIGR00290 family)
MADLPASKIKLSLSWSGGKDSAFALWKLLNDCHYEVCRLHTTLGESTRRVGMHGIHENLIESQAESLRLPLDRIYYPASGDNAAYEQALKTYLNSLESEGIRHVAFGDIFLEDLRKYREVNLAQIGFSAIFPLWKMNTLDLANDFIRFGFKTKICAADADLISKDQMGKDFSPEFLESLPVEADPCGENGEFHSFCYAGPIFNKPLNIHVENILSKSYDIPLADGGMDKKHYWFADIHLADFKTF